MDTLLDCSLSLDSVHVPQAKDFKCELCALKPEESQLVPDHQLRRVTYAGTPGLICPKHFQFVMKKKSTKIANAKAVDQYAASIRTDTFENPSESSEKNANLQGTLTGNYMDRYDMVRSMVNRDKESQSERARAHSNPHHRSVTRVSNSKGSGASNNRKSSRGLGDRLHIANEYTHEIQDQNVILVQVHVVGLGVATAKIKKPKRGICSTVQCDPGIGANELKDLLIKSCKAEWADCNFGHSLVKERVKLVYQSSLLEITKDSKCLEGEFFRIDKKTGKKVYCRPTKPILVYLAMNSKNYEEYLSYVEQKEDAEDFAEKLEVTNKRVEPESVDLTADSDHSHSASESDIPNATSVQRKTATQTTSRSDTKADRSVGPTDLRTTTHSIRITPREAVEREPVPKTLRRSSISQSLRDTELMPPPPPPQHTVTPSRSRSVDTESFRDDRSYREISSASRQTPIVPASDSRLHHSLSPLSGNQRFVPQAFQDPFEGGIQTPTSMQASASRLGVQHHVPSMNWTNEWADSFSGRQTGGHTRSSAESRSDVHANDEKVDRFAHLSIKSPVTRDNGFDLFLPSITQKSGLDIPPLNAAKRSTAAAQLSSPPRSRKSVRSSPSMRSVPSVMGTMPMDISHNDDKGGNVANSSSKFKPFSIDSEALIKALGSQTSEDTSASSVRTSSMNFLERITKKIEVRYVKSDLTLDQLSKIAKAAADRKELDPDDEVHAVELAFLGEKVVPSTIELDISKAPLKGTFKISRDAVLDPKLPCGASLIVAKQAFKPFPTEQGDERLYLGPDQAMKLGTEIRCFVWASALLNLVYAFIAHHVSQHGDAPFPIPQFRFVDAAFAWEVVMTPGGMAKLTCWLLEQRLILAEQGPWVKYINNNAPVALPLSDIDARRRAEFLLFTQHVQYMLTRKFAFVSDYQGGSSLLNDPQIITSPQNGRRLFGAGNVSVGFERFEVDHKCNVFCKYFGLDPSFRKFCLTD